MALAILSISLVTLLSAHNKALSMSAEAAAMTDAVTLGREEMEKLYIDLSPETGVSDKKKRDDYPEFEWRVEIKETPFPTVWEAGIKVFNAGDKNERPVFKLTSYLAK